MGMTRGVALVPTIARVTQLTGIQNLTNLESTSELSIADLLVSASDAIYDQLESDGIDPTVLSNPTVYERAVAWHALANLVILGYLQPPEDGSPPQNEQGQADPYAWSDPHYRRARPKQADKADPSRSHEGIPAVANPARFPSRFGPFA